MIKFSHLISNKMFQIRYNLVTSYEQKKVSEELSRKVQNKTALYVRNFT